MPATAVASQTATGPASGRKRKVAFEASERPAKKQQTSGSIKVNHLNRPGAVQPVIATSPGSNIPSNLKFNTYTNDRSVDEHELLLQSSDHASIDYTATETKNSSSTDKFLKHYVAVFDPTTGRLDVTEAKRMTIRNVVRQFDTGEDTDQESAPAPGYASRAALTEAFGTKKSKKAAQSIAENRLLARGGADDVDPLSQAIAATVKEEDDEPSSSPQLTKPLPQADIDTTDIREVYSLSMLVIPQSETLKSMPLQKWRQTMSSKKQVSVAFRYVANRIGYLMPAHIAAPDDEDYLRHLQVLRYIYLLLDIHKFAARHSPKKPMPFPDQWPEDTISGTIASTTLRALCKHFFPERKSTRFSITLLRTTILALTLHIPPPSFITGNDTLVTEPTDISLDLGVDKAEVIKLYRELGSKVESATDTQLERWGLLKLYTQPKVDEEGKAIKVSKPRFARLTFPITFVKVSQGRSLAGQSRR